MGRDGCGGVDGWYVDNVNVATCVQKAAATITAVHAPEPSAFGRAHSMDVTVAGDTTPTGTVTVLEGETVLGTADLADGAASVALPRNMKVGAHSLTVNYSGDDTFASDSTEATATIAKASSRTTGVGRPNPVHRTKTITGTVKVTAAGTTPTGAVKILSGGKLVGKGNLSSGMVKIQITKDFPVGTRTFVVKYLGSDSVSASRDTFTVKIIK